MTESSPGRFPFGQEVSPVVPNVSGRRQFFVLGVYPSAFHVRWTDPKGAVCPALAVDNEPEPFWTGRDALQLLKAVAESVPSEAGQVELPDDQFNGASGRALDELYLAKLGPEGISRERCWISDIVQTYLANEGQVERIRKSYEPLVAAGICPPSNLAKRGAEFRTMPPGRQESLRAELEEADPDILITLGNEPLSCLGFGRLEHQDYGQIRTVEVLGMKLRLLPLVHPRQAAGLGMFSQEWMETHRTWHTDFAGTLKF